MSSSDEQASILEITKPARAIVWSRVKAGAAETAADIREELINKINDHEAKLLAQAEANYDGVKSINDVVTGYLASLEELKAATDTLRGSILSVAEISDSDIPASIQEILAISQNPSEQGEE